MMRKKLWTAALACMMALAISVPVFAADWVQDSTGWWYQYDDGSYPNNGWSWINGKCYYFTPEGYCLTGTQTPDGYTVDESGAWTVDGVVQVQNPDQTENVQTGGAQATANSVLMDGMTFTVPEGFVQDTSQTDSYYFENTSNAIFILYESSDLLLEDGMSVEEEKELLDSAMEEAVGTPLYTATLQTPSGTWYRYDYMYIATSGFPGGRIVYARIHESQLQIMQIAGDTLSFDTDAVIINNLK